MARPSDAGKDKALLELLRANARKPISEIAAALGVSRSTVQARLARLERDGVIAGYTIATGPGAETGKALTAILLIEIDARRQNSVVAALKKRPEVVSCYTMNGPFDLFVTIRSDSAAELDEVIDRIAALEGVRRTTSSILLVRKFGR